MFEKLTLKSVNVRTVVVPLRRPIVSKVGLFKEWPLILIDLLTNEGITGRSYLEPYLKNAAPSIVAAIEDIASRHTGQALSPLDVFDSGRRSLNLVGYEGIAMIAISGIDMAIWDALGQAAGMPLAVLLGGSIGAVPAYNSNGLWLVDVCGNRSGSGRVWSQKEISQVSSFDSAGTGSPMTWLRSKRSATPQATTSS